MLTSLHTFKFSTACLATFTRASRFGVWISSSFLSVVDCSRICFCLFSFAAFCPAGCHLAFEVPSGWADAAASIECRADAVASASDVTDAVVLAGSVFLRVEVFSGFFFSSKRTFLTFEDTDGGATVDLGGDLARDGADLCGDCRRGDSDLSRLEYFRLGGDGDLHLGGVEDSGVSSSSSDAVVSTNSLHL